MPLMVYLLSITIYVTV